MKPILFLSSVVIFLSIFTIGITFAQAAPVSDLPYALFKTDIGEYQIQYNITNAKLEATFVDIPARAFMFIVNATEDGQLSVNLPRKIIDSTRDGKDRPYFVSLGDLTCCHKRIKVDEIRNNSEIRIVTINFTKGLKQVQLSGTFFVENNRPWTAINPYNGEWSPLKQWHLGVDSQDVICKNGFQLIIKARDDLPACVKQESTPKLIQRNWIKIEKLRFENYDDELSYYFGGGKVPSAKIFGFKRDMECVGPGCGFDYTSYILLPIDTKSNGLLVLVIPREIIGATGEFERPQFFVLVGPEEVDYLDASNSTDVILAIKIPSNATTVEVFGFGNYNQDLPSYGTT